MPHSGFTDSPALRSGRCGVEELGAAADGCPLARLGGEHHRSGGAPELSGRGSLVGHRGHSSLTLSLPAESQHNEEKPSNTRTPHPDRVCEDFVADDAFMWVNASAQPAPSGEKVVQPWASPLFASIALLRIEWSTTTQEAADSGERP